MLVAQDWRGGVAESGLPVQWCPGTVITQRAFPVVSKTEPLGLNSSAQSASEFVQIRLTGSYFSS